MNEDNMTVTTLPELKSKIEGLAFGQPRILVAIAGPPASGKSTLAEDLACTLGSTAVVLPMDGFHLENDQLQEMGLLHRKGAPETFDAEGFVSLLRRVRNESTIPFPTFDREADKIVPNSGQIHEGTRIVLIEGNYLLLNLRPWSDLNNLFDLTVWLKVDREELEARLISRWLTHGLQPDDARTRVLGNDKKNVTFVEANSIAPDVTLKSRRSQVIFFPASKLFN
ncbi:phosphoribulokinase [Pseudopelagicola sp. nBUS_20]|uniref:phosphoribulokinase n=1 Tax=Pseudopelagicola sp. nBUS_20 TaxID=3395317 RepID=UPI003EBA66FE